LTLPVTQRAVFASDPFDFLAVSPPYPTLLQSVSDRIQKLMLIEWLRKELESPRFHGPSGGTYIAVCGQEDNWNLATFVGKQALKVEPGQIGHLQVEHQTRTDGGIFAQQEFLRRAETFSQDANGAYQSGNGFPHRSVVVDHDYHIG
jgi:hypothetical protein